jgi:hypothetical protein
MSKGKGLIRVCIDQLRRALGRSDDLRDEWFILSTGLLAKRPDIAEAVETFEGDPRHPVSTEGARWFQQAKHERACVTRLLFRDNQLAGFYSLASAEVEISRQKELERLGIQGGPRVPASHIEWIMRSKNFKGIGEAMLWHAALVARDVAGMQGNLVLSLDPYDDKTAKMWRDAGFVRSATELEAGLHRMYVPLFGYRALADGRE